MKAQHQPERLLARRPSRPAHGFAWRGGRFNGWRSGWRSGWRGVWFGVWLAVGAATAATPATPATAAPSGAKAAAESVVPPALVEEAVPVYPATMRGRGLAGRVVVELDIDATGAVRQPKVVESAGPDFDAAALEAASRLRFSPATARGKPIAVRIRYAFRFDADQPRRARSAGLGGYPRRELERSIAGAVSLRGLLRELGTGRPVAGALVILPRLGQETLSEADGSFAFGALPAGAVPIEVRSPEHKPLTGSTGVADGRTTRVELRLERRSYTVYRATAVAPPAPGEMARRELSAEEIQRVPGVYGDSFKVVQNLPGVARAPAISGEIIVRGAAPDDTQILIEGVRVPAIYHFGGVYSVMNTDLLEGIDFYPGGFAARYGRKTGGVLEARLRLQRPDEGWHGYVEGNVFHTGALLRGPLGASTQLTLAARRSYIDAVLTAVIPDGVLPFTVAPRYWDYQAKLDHSFGRNLDATLLVLGSDDALALIIDRPPPGFGSANASLEAGINFHGGIAQLRYRAPGVESRSTLGVVRSAVGFGFGELFQVDAHSWQLTVRQDVRLWPGEAVELRFGLDLFNEPYVADVRLPPQAADEGEGADAEAGRRVFTVDTNLLQPAIWLDAVYRLHPRLEVVPGLRLDLYRDALSSETVLPRLNVRFRASDVLTLKAATGVLSQAPSAEQVVERFGNPNLLPFRSFEVSGGFEWALGDRLTLDVQGFRKQLWDRVVGPREPWRTFAWENAGRGRVIGLELLARHRPVGNFFGWVAYTLMRGTETPHPGDAERLLPWDQTHIFTAVGSYRLPFNWEASARFRLVSGNPYTGIGTAVFNANDADYVSVDSACLQCERLPTFHQLDLRIDRKFIWESWMLAVYLDVQNVYNRQNPESINYNFDYQLSAYQALLPIIPSIGMRGEF